MPTSDSPAPAYMAGRFGENRVIIQPADQVATLTEQNMNTTFPHSVKHMGVSMSPLEKKLNSLIAKQLGVRPEEVTIEFVRNVRRKRIYPKIKVDFNTRIGGLVSNKRQLTGEEAERAIKVGEEFLHQFASSQK